MVLHMHERNDGDVMSTIILLIQGLNPAKMG